MRGSADVRVKDVCLQHRYGLKTLASEIVKVFISQPVLDKPLRIDQFHGEYSKLFGRQMMYKNCGFASLPDLIKSLQAIIEVSNSPSQGLLFLPEYLYILERIMCFVFQHLRNTVSCFILVYLLPLSFVL